MRTALILGGLALLAGCGPLVQVGSPKAVPAVLYTIRADAPLPAPAAGQLGPIVVVEHPAVVGKIQTLRVPVLMGDTRIAYLKDAQWVENPSRLMQRLLVDRMNAAGMTAVGPGIREERGRLVTTTIREFGLDARDRAAPKAVVRLDVVLSGTGGKLLGARQFEADVPIANETPDAVVNGLSVGANRVAGELADWVRGV